MCYNNTKYLSKRGFVRTVITVGFFFLFCLYPPMLNALTLKNIFQNNDLLIEKAFLEKKLSHLDLKILPNNDKFKYIFNDPENKISSTFKIPDFFSDAVNFWFKVYTIYGRNLVAIHDKTNFNIIYDVIDYSELNSSILNIFTKSAIQSGLTMDRVRSIRKTLVKMAQEKYVDDESKRILNSLDFSKTKIPSDPEKRSQFFLKLSENIRTQTGQRDNIIQGLKNIQSYKYLIKKYFKLFRAPKELLAIAFVESSFNYLAKSRVGATGAWQFMPRVGRFFMPVNKYNDSRLNPILSSIGALHLLKQNMQILKTWDLAITAYNAGTKHLLKAKRRLKRKKMSLEDILTSYYHPHIGFAAQNYYSEFLAMIYVLAYADKLFNMKSIKILRFKEKKIDIYISLCKFRPSFIYNALSKTSPDLRYLNLHLLSNKRIYPRGTIFISDRKLTKRRYFKVQEKYYTRYYLKNWKKLIRNQSCSTR